MNELTDLYQELIIDHGRHPRNFGKVENATHQHEGHNPLCGDQLMLYLIVENDVIKEAMFTGSGCAISVASASMMTQFLKNKKVAEAKKYFESFHHLVMDKETKQDVERLGKLNALAGVKAFPMRVKCATLSWHTLMAALENNNGITKTE